MGLIRWWQANDETVESNIDLQDLSDLLERAIKGVTVANAARQMNWFRGKTNRQIYNDLARRNIRAFQASTPGTCWYFDSTDPKLAKVVRDLPHPENDIG